MYSYINYKRKYPIYFKNVKTAFKFMIDDLPLHKRIYYKHKYKNKNMEDDLMICKAWNIHSSCITKVNKSCMLEMMGK